MQVALTVPGCLLLKVKERVRETRVKKIQNEKVRE